MKVTIHHITSGHLIYCFEALRFVDEENLGRRRGGVDGGGGGDMSSLSNLDPLEELLFLIDCTRLYYWSVSEKERGGEWERWEERRNERELGWWKWGWDIEWKGALYSGVFHIWTLPLVREGSLNYRVRDPPRRILRKIKFFACGSLEHLLFLF